MAGEQMLATPLVYRLDVSCPLEKDFAQVALTLEQLLGQKHSLSGPIDGNMTFGFYYATRYERDIACTEVEDNEPDLVPRLRKDLDPETDMPREIEQALHVVRQLQWWIDHTIEENAIVASFTWTECGMMISVDEQCVWESENCGSDCMTFECCKSEFRSIARTYSKLLPAETAAAK